ncbi:MAG: hypothetical protein IPO39_03575 [Bacteroidetes bacterium]|nr:hypothetical protein [Bacteroidota bacterium]
MKVITTTVKNIHSNATRKIVSANYSYRFEKIIFFVRIDKKESILESINNKADNAVNSSISVLSE